MEFIYRLVTGLGAIVTAKPDFFKHEKLVLKFLGNTDKCAAILNINGTTSYQNVSNGTVTITKDLLKSAVKKDGVGHISIFIIQTEPPLSKWQCEGIGVALVGEEMFVFPDYEETGKRIDMIEHEIGILTKKVSRIEKTMSRIDDKVSEFVGGDITE